MVAVRRNPSLPGSRPGSSPGSSQSPPDPAPRKKKLVIVKDFAYINKPQQSSVVRSTLNVPAKISTSESKPRNHRRRRRGGRNNGRAKIRNALRKAELRLAAARRRMAKATPLKRTTRVRISLSHTQEAVHVSGPRLMSGSTPLRRTRGGFLDPLPPTPPPQPPAPEPVKVKTSRLNKNHQSNEIGRKRHNSAARTYARRASRREWRRAMEAAIQNEEELINGPSPSDEP